MKQKEIDFVDLFLSRKVAFGALMLGLTALVIKVLHQYGVLISTRTTEINIAGILGIMFIAYGLLVLAQGPLPEVKRFDKDRGETTDGKTNQNRD